jgi:hypothetical protein
MFRHGLVLLAGLALTSSATAASWADGMFRELSKDFGSVARGPRLEHPFHITNNTGQPVHITDVRVSCGCVTTQVVQPYLQPGQNTIIQAYMDTSRFSGVKTVTIYVHIDQPRDEEVRLWVHANSRDDVSVTPESLAFGQVKRGSAPASSVNVTFLGNGQWQILAAQCDSHYVQTSLREVGRGMNEVTYQLTAKLRADAPVGKWYSDIWLATNNAATPRVRVPLTVEIQSALSISPPSLVLGPLKVGAQTERKVIVRGVRPFRITDVKGADDALSVRDSSTESKPVHVLSVTLKAIKAGEPNWNLRVLTDLAEEGEIEFHARAQITP